MYGRGGTWRSEGVAADVALPPAAERACRAHHIWEDGPGEREIASHNLSKMADAGFFFHLLFCIGARARLRGHLQELRVPRHQGLHGQAGAGDARDRPQPGGGTGRGPDAARGSSKARTARTADAAGTAAAGRTGKQVSNRPGGKNKEETAVLHKG